jgi:hypothetical protein
VDFFPHSEVNRLRSGRSTAKPISSKIDSDDLTRRQVFDISPGQVCSLREEPFISKFAASRQSRRVDATQLGFPCALPASRRKSHIPDWRSQGRPSASPAIFGSCCMRPRQRPRSHRSSRSKGRKAGSMKRLRYRFSNSFRDNDRGHTLANIYLGQRPQPLKRDTRPNAGVTPAFRGCSFSAANSYSGPGERSDFLLSPYASNPWNDVHSCRLFGMKHRGVIPWT